MDRGPQGGPWQTKSMLWPTLRVKCFWPSQGENTISSKNWSSWSKQMITFKGGGFRPKSNQVYIFYLFLYPSPINFQKIKKKFVLHNNKMTIFTPKQTKNWNFFSKKCKLGHISTPDSENGGETFSKIIFCQNIPLSTTQKWLPTNEA